MWDWFSPTDLSLSRLNSMMKEVLRSETLGLCSSIRTVFYYLTQPEHNGRTLTVCWPDTARHQQIPTSGGSLWALTPPALTQDISVNLYTAWHLYGRTGRRGTIWQPRQHQSIERCNPFGHALTNGPWDVWSSITSKWVEIYGQKVKPILKILLNVTE